MDSNEDTTQGLTRRLQTGPRILGFHDVLLCILDALPFKVLSSFGATCTSGRDAIREVMRMRLARLLNTYIDGRKASFGRIFSNASAVISGSSALWMLLVPAHWQPNDLNIVVPRGKTDGLLDFFLALHYTNHDGPVHPQRRTAVHKFRRLSRGQNAVTIMESANDSVFPPVLSSSTTLDLNIVTMGSIACMYPALTLNNAGFACSASTAQDDVLQRANVRQLGIYPYSVPWIGRCGYSCPTLSRRLYALEGCAVLNWQRENEQHDFSDIRLLASTSHYSWTINSQCKNPFCEWQLP